MRKEKDKSPLGSVVDVKCRANRSKAITRKICKNNCKYWKKKKCELGY